MYVLFRFEEIFRNDSSVLNQKRKFLDHLELGRNQEDAAFSWHDVSVPGLAEYKNIEGDQWVNWRERGYSMILDILMVNHSI